MSETKENQPGEVTATGSKAAPPVKAILGKKLGMTRVYDDAGRFTAVTVVEAGPCPVMGVRSKSAHGYDAVQLAFGEIKEKNVTAALKGQYAKAGVSPRRWTKEFRVKSVDGFEPGQEVRAENFTAGDKVDVSGVNKGKGYAGVMKRHRFHGGPRTHGQSDRARAPGSSGGQLPQKVFKGVRGPGHMGAEWSTVQRIEVVKVNAEDNLILLKGSVPGPNGALVTIRETTRPRRISKATSQAAKKPAKKK